ncbi:MAG TPA: 5-formyltetrahydrofolate cyclo-ligase [Angustibacter sp.]|nr:5-formyltetrahydrofolate cyclo-ligase [Angustibacter sp.]
MMADAGARSTQAAKAALRRAARARRRSASLRPADAEALRDLVCALPEVQRASRVAAYVSGPLEPPTAPLLDRWRQEQRAVLLPVVLPDLDLDWALDDAAHRPGLLAGVHEPSGERLGVDAVRGADVVVVPALTADRAGRRLGQGGGSYDRALARVAPHALVVALVHPDELVAGPLPTEAHDRRVDVVVTAREVVRVSPRG